MKRIVILGAGSSIAQAVERLMAKDGLDLCLVGRSESRLKALQSDLVARGAHQVSICESDLDDAHTHAGLLRNITQTFGAFDTVLLAYGSLLDQPATQTSAELALREIHTNFVSAASLLTLFAECLAAEKSGTIAVITSVAGDRGRRSNYVYGSAKGGLSLFVEGLRSRMHPLGVRVVTIKPGPVDTPMTASMPKKKGFASPEAVGKDIYRFLQRSRGDVLYTPAKWRLIMAAVRGLPHWAIKRIDF
jgi:decaprenylphospho-beta-D-erythro-pentofuranosid-2-ulose 2-reductase